jgi:hypothetical protein
MFIKNTEIYNMSTTRSYLMAGLVGKSKASASVETDPLTAQENLLRKSI